MHEPSSGDAWRRRLPRCAASLWRQRSRREKCCAISDGAGSHEPEEDRGPEACGHKAKPGDDHSFADEVPEIRADHEQEHERDDDRGDRRVSKVKECEWDDWKQGGQEWRNAVDERAEDRGELEGLLAFLAESLEDRSPGRADVELLLGPLRVVDNSVR